MDLGFDHVYVHQVGPDQGGLLGFYEEDVFPAVRELEPQGAREAVRA